MTINLSLKSASIEYLKDIIELSWFIAIYTLISILRILKNQYQLKKIEKNIKI
jgi:hypothetical protein